MHKFLRKSAGDLAKCDGNFNQKRIMLKWVFENIRKRSKTFKNIRKRANFRVETFENIQKYSNFLQGGAHLIDFCLSAKINQKY